jgi:hypothetical protein
MSTRFTDTRSKTYGHEAYKKVRPRLVEAWSAFPLTLADAAGCGGRFSEPALAATMVCGEPEDAENDDKLVVLEPTPSDAAEAELDAEGGVTVDAIFAVLETTSTDAVVEAELDAADGDGDAAAASLARNR